VGGQRRGGVGGRGREEMGRGRYRKKERKKKQRKEERMFVY
jgi:hypothetical protein